MEQQQTPNKTGIIVTCWDSLRQDRSEFARFIAFCQQAFANTGLIVFSTTPSPAVTTFLREYLPLSLLCGPNTMSQQRLARLTARQFYWNGQNCTDVTQPAPQTISTNPVFGLVVSNGFGLGHVTRMTRIKQGLEQFGPCHTFSFSGGLWQNNIFYAPSAQYLELETNDGHAYTKEAMQQFIATTSPTHILYDGNVLPTGLLSVLSHRPDIHLSWVRRGMWQADVNPKFMAQQGYADVVIEPGDLSEEFDTGPTWAQRLNYCAPNAFLKTPPIKPALCDHIPLDRAQARQELGLDDTKRYALIMLGAAQKVEDWSLLHNVLAHIKAVPNLTPVLAHWPISHDAPPQIPDVQVIERMPLAHLYPAFDVLVSAAGYNSFHEIIATGAPVVFLPQDDAGRDQQVARAAWAATNGLAATCRRADLSALPAQILQILQQGSTHALSPQWLEDWAGFAKTMGIQADKDINVSEHDFAAHTKELSPKLPKQCRAIIKACIKRHKKSGQKPYATTFILAIDHTADTFTARMKQEKLNATNTIILTNSIPPIILRRAGYKYVWLNHATLANHWQLKRQILKWHAIWRPVDVVVL